MLREDFKDDIFAGARKYQMVKNSDGTVSFIDVTEYTQEGDAIGAAEFNKIGQDVNGKLDKSGDGSNTTVAFSQAGTLANIETGEKQSALMGKIAKAVKSLISHIADTNPHGVTKSDVGLGKVGNFKSVSTEAQTLTAAEKAQARANIGAGTSSFSGSYNDLSGKPAIPAAVRVKGNVESSYRTGDVNLKPEHIGALALSGGTMTGSLAVDAGGGVTSVIGGGDVNLCADTLVVSPGTVKARGGMSVQVLNGLPYCPVVIGASAPSDKTALWIDTST